MTFTAILGSLDMAAYVRPTRQFIADENIVRRRDSLVKST